ncbi:Protein of uncharacterised function DUF124 [Chromobacterium violaceum]|uniref:Protein of uncharacterized function DUF124 n=1 Tax=Chromobacterium violaceum TaxID=536 RepID=A0A3S4LG03_CHRVL|nr:Protein of uncharacterised function DUF124 [Chromobacterium violaceum]
MPVHLLELGGTLYAQKDSFLAGAKGVSLGLAWQKRIGTGLFGGEGFIMQKLEGDGYVFLHAGGALTELQLRPGETVRVDTGCVVAYQPSVDFDIEYVGKLKSALFGGEGLFFARLTGPGRVWLQSLPCRGWPTASSPPRRAPAGNPRNRARCWRPVQRQELGARRQPSSR